MKRLRGARHPRVRQIALVCAVACFGLAGTAQAQAVRGTLLGTVFDSQGAAVPGVAVTATETQTNIARAVVTNQNGYFLFANLKDGLYQVTAELDGFKTTVRNRVEVKVNSTVRVDMTLELGAMQETVVVAAETPLLQTDRVDVGRTIEGRQIAELPLAQGRNFQALWTTVPGSTTVSRPHSQFFNPQDSMQTKFNGQSRLSNNVQIDGLDNNHKTGLLTVLIPSAESIDSVNVTTSNFDAEFGRAGGSVTSVVMKSGTNQFKGSAFYFGNSESTQARSYFASPDSEKPETKYQQFGATLGGPIAKDRLFFFVDYQRTVDNLGQLRRRVIPPDPWRLGDFSGADTIIYDPATGNPDGTGRQPFPGNIVPADRISPVAAAILARIPATNVAGDFGQVNFELPSFTRQKTTHAFNVKLNYNPTVDDQLSFRFGYQRPEVFVPGTFGEIGGGGTGFNGTGLQETYSTALNWTRILSPSLIMEWRVGLLKYDNSALSNGQGLESSTEVGIPGANFDDFSSGISQITISGFNNPVVGFSNSLPWVRGEETYSVVGTITKLTGNHSLKIGTEVRHNEDFLLQLQDAGGVRGQFSFGSAQTAIPDDSAAVNGIANSFASFLLDVPGTVQRDIRALDRPGTQHWGIFAFIQDKWQVSPKLTLDLGLRWEYYTPHVGIESQGGLANYDPTNNTVRVAGFGNIPQNIGVGSTFTNFAPRLGAAYRIDERTVLRGGFGTSIIPFPGNRYAFNFPVKQTNQFTAPNSFATAGSMAAGFGPPDFFPIPNDGVVDANIPQLANSVLFHVPTDLKEAKIHSWNVAFQRELFWDLVVDIAYVGNIAKNVLANFQLNAGMELGADRDGQPFNQSFGRTARVQTWRPADSSYKALQVKLDRRFRNGFLLNSSYTLSRATNFMDDNGTINTPADIARSEGPAGFDRTHVFASSFIWDMPFFKDDRSALGQILGGWQISGLFTAYSGSPINFTSSGATLRAPNNTQRPNVNGTPAIFGDVGPGQLYFDTSAFSAPAQNTWGNITRNGSIRGPGFWNLDASLVKRLRFNERVAAELRVDAFNVTNTPRFNNPNGSFGNSRFGQITSASGARLVRFGVRLLF